MTMHNDSTPPDRARHPEALENRRRGARVLVGVPQEAAIERGTLPLWGRRQAVEVLLTRGRIAHWYAPFVHRELPGELAKLRAADPDQIVAFAQTYGPLGFPALAFEGGDTSVLFHVDPVTGARSQGGDPLPWIRAHAAGVALCLALHDALARRVSADTLRQLVDACAGERWADGAHAEVVGVDWTAGGGWTPRELARQIRNRIINANVSRIYRYVHVDEKGRDRSYFGFRTVVDVVYWHLANLVDGGVVKQCEAAGCGAFFIQTDPRQRFCPKRFRQYESACAARQRQRDHRPAPARRRS